MLNHLDDSPGFFQAFAAGLTLGRQLDPPSPTSNLPEPPTTWQQVQRMAEPYRCRFY